MQKPELQVEAESGDSFVQLGYPANEPPLWVNWEAADTALTIFSGHHGRILTVGLDGSVLQETFLGDWVDSLFTFGAVRLASGWVLASRNQSGDVILRLAYAGGERKFVKTLIRREYAAAFPDSLADLGAHLRSTAEGFAITLWWPPCTTYLFDADGSPSGELNPPTCVPARTAGSAGDRQSTVGSSLMTPVALPALPLDSGFVQTIADLRSDQRSLLLFDRDRRFVRSSQLDIPMALVSTDLRTRHLVAVRDVGKREVVEYRWSWQSN